MTFKEHLRLIWAITAKDLLEALKNKNTITVLISSLFLVVLYRAMPGLERGDAPPMVLLYDQGQSSLVVAMHNSPLIDLYTYDSQEDMQRHLADGQNPELGLVVPADFDRRLAEGSNLEVDGYTLFWVKESDAIELKRTLEDELYHLAGAPVEINLRGVVYPEPLSTGLGLLTSLAFVFVILMTGMIVPPHLMLEEKQTHTMEVLMVSPASACHITIAKALTGAFYCLISIGAAFALNYTAIYNWPLAVLAALVGALFCVSIGLILGTVIESRQQLMLFGWLFLIPLMMPVLLSIMDDLLPETLITIFRWIPTTALFRAWRVAFSNQAPIDLWVPQLVWVGAWAALALLGVAWLVRRQDR